jgi:hypothetical protein
MKKSYGGVLILKANRKKESAYSDSENIRNKPTHLKGKLDVHFNTIGIRLAVGVRHRAEIQGS